MPAMLSGRRLRAAKEPRDDSGHGVFVSGNRDDPEAL
jgi:hypothetical protein